MGGKGGVYLLPPSPAVLKSARSLTLDSASNPVNSIILRIRREAATRRTGRYGRVNVDVRLYPRDRGRCSGLFVLIGACKVEG